MAVLEMIKLFLKVFI